MAQDSVKTCNQALYDHTSDEHIRQKILKDGARLEFFAHKIWPLLRHFVTKTPRCSRCLISAQQLLVEAKPGLNGQGMCPTCVQDTGDTAAKKAGDLVEMPTDWQQRFDQRIQSVIKSSSGPYHGVLMLSGGKDSAYVLYHMRQRYPDFKILALIVNNGFMSPIATDNARFAAERTRTDFVIVNSKVQDFYDAIRYALLHLDGAQPASTVIDYTDGSMIFETGQQYARELGIPLVISGVSWVQLAKHAQIFGFESPADAGGVPQLFPLALWRPNEQEIRAEVERLRLLPAGKSGPLVTNSTIVVAMAFIDILRNGYSGFEGEFAQLIREGKTSRKHWLYTFEVLEFFTRKGFLTKDAEKILARLDITLAEVLKK